jgi:2-oxoglutarate/2-oxoacid ferredoxin oxidoreductase subunit alpha
MDIPLQEVHGPAFGDLLVFSWGGTYGACVTAVERCQARGAVRGSCPPALLESLPANLGDLLEQYDKC